MKFIKYNEVLDNRISKMLSGSYFYFFWETIGSDIVSVITRC